jgi:hypothetical protein
MDFRPGAGPFGFSPKVGTGLFKRGFCSRLHASNLNLHLSEHDPKSANRFSEKAMPDRGMTPGSIQRSWIGPQGSCDGWLLARNARTFTRKSMHFAQRWSTTGPPETDASWLVPAAGPRGAIPRSGRRSETIRLGQSRQTGQKTRARSDAMGSGPALKGSRPVYWICLMPALVMMS